LLHQLLVHPHDQPKVKERLRQLIHVPFKFEFSGSRVIFFDPEEDFTEQAQLWEERAKDVQQTDPAATPSQPTSG